MFCGRIVTLRQRLQASTGRMRCRASTMHLVVVNLFSSNEQAMFGWSRLQALNEASASTSSVGFGFAALEDRREQVEFLACLCGAL